MTFNKRLSLNDAIALVLRKVQVSSTLVKVLNIRREVGICEKVVILSVLRLPFACFCVFFVRACEWIRVHVCMFVDARVFCSCVVMYVYACSWIHVLFLRTCAWIHAYACLCACMCICGAIGDLYEHFFFS